MRFFAVITVTLTALSSTALAAPGPSPSQPNLHKRSACYPAFITLLKEQAYDLCTGNGVVIEQKNVRFDALTADVKYDGKYNDAPGKDAQPMTLDKGQVTSIWICQSCTPPPATTGTPHRF